MIHPVQSENWVERRTEYKEIIYVVQKFPNERC